ncbi:MAG: hypothetical protein V1787_04150 [Candidatus Micrarchaeota archaeon]
MKPEKELHYVVVSIVGSDSDAADALYAGLRDFPADKVVMLSEPKDQPRAERIKKDLEKFKVPAVIENLESGVSMEEVFGRVAAVRDRELGKRLVVNIDTDYKSSCIALSAAFVNGIQAIGLSEGSIIAYPIMKFSYYTALSEKKLMLLRLISDRNGVKSLEELSKAADMSLPLATYHVRGTRDKPGLEELGLVETFRNKGRLEVNLSALGRLIIKGRVDISADKDAARTKQQKHARVI